MRSPICPYSIASHLLDSCGKGCNSSLVNRRKCKRQMSDMSGDVGTCWTPSGVTAIVAVCKL